MFQTRLVLTDLMTNTKKGGGRTRTGQGQRANDGVSWPSKVGSLKNA